MTTYETSATVENHGQVRLAGVPFAPGTEVEVTLRPKVRSAGEVTTQDHEGLRWEGNVLVHQGVGTGPSVAELRDERLNRLAEG